MRRKGRKGTRRKGEEGRGRKGGDYGREEEGKLKEEYRDERQA